MRNLLLAFFPAVVLGLAFGDQIDALLENAVVVAWALIVGGVAILIVERLAKTENVLGIAGVSVGAVGQDRAGPVPGDGAGRQPVGRDDHGRDGARHRSAHRGRFQLLPGDADADRRDRAAALQASRRDHAGDIELIAIGFVVSFVVALAVVKAFLAVVTRYGFAPFAWYRIVAGAAALVWLSIADRSESADILCS